MTEPKERTRITAIVTIEGPAEQILADVQRLHHGKRSVRIDVELRTRGYYGYPEDHMIPKIEGGNTKPALAKLANLHHQAIVDDETDRRLENLIVEFGRFTE